MCRKSNIICVIAFLLISFSGYGGILPFSQVPDYDSGWIAVNKNTPITLQHQLGGNVQNYIVDMEYKSASSFNGINLRYAGGADFGTNPPGGHAENDRVGAYWRTLTSSSITIYRRPEDSYASYMRIRIWKNAVPDYDSGWVDIDKNSALTLTHNLGDDAEKYMVDMEYKNATSGINLRYKGGMDFGTNPPGGHAENDRVGAYWRSLTSSSVTVYRRPEDSYASSMRIRIWKNTTPNYDSGWVTINTNTARTFTHNLGDKTENYVVDMQYKNSGSGINLRYAGGADFGTKPAPGHAENDRVGAYWRTLTSSSVTVYRRPEDSYASSVRIRIWKHNAAYLPPLYYLLMH